MSLRIKKEQSGTEPDYDRRGCKENKSQLVMLRKKRRASMNVSTHDSYIRMRIINAYLLRAFTEPTQ